VCGRLGRRKRWCEHLDAKAIRMAELRASLPQAGCGRWDAWMGISRTVCKVVPWNTQDYYVWSSCVRAPVKAEGVVVRGRPDLREERGSRDDKDLSKK
jgi:hypothetical protein